MSRLKQLFRYFLILLVLYVIVDIAAFFILKSEYYTKEYQVEQSVLDVEVTEAKATFVNGNIKGIIRNNTGSSISNKYLQLDAYSKRDVLLGTKYIKIKDLLSGSRTDFEASFNYEQVDHINIKVVDGEDLPESELDFSFDNPDDAKYTWGVLLGAFILLIDNGFIWVLL